MKIQLMVETITVMVFEELSFVAKIFFFFTLLSQEYVKNHVLLLWNTVAFILVNSLFGRGKSQVSEPKWILELCYSVQHYSGRVELIKPWNRGRRERNFSLINKNRCLSEIE